ncbi:extracellular solute-binding protein [Methylobacterium sp.]|uniref:extracellular solute-binding protein n=1 Tax=Methylobacterium sp. TaxID=409 RepID=UPI0025D14399|nr:extracellular solute-binding protein [Methylobacterium sp.]
MHLLTIVPVRMASADGRTEITIYTAIESEQIAWITEGLAKALPEVKPVWVRGSTGAITDRLLGEKERPQADVALGIGASSLMLLEQAGMLAEYKPAGAAELRSFFLDPAPPYTWTGMDAYLGAVCFNTDLGRSLTLMRPVLWRELLAPGFKGRIAMPNPRLSGTGFLLVAGWLQSMGETAAWEFMDALHANVAAYLPTGSDPCYGAGNGTYVAGLSFDMRGAAERAKGAPIEVIVPVDGVGWEQEASAILKTTRHPDLSRRIMDWTASKEANAIYARSFAIVAHPGVANAAPDYPAHAEARMIKVDLQWKTRNRERILQEWTRRYGEKVQPPR